MKKVSAIVLAAALTTTSVFAHQGATGVVKERMDAMSDIAAQLKSVNLMIRGTNDFDAAAVRAAMEKIADHAAMLPHQFPEGTDAAPSEAAPLIWTETEEFNAIFAQLELSAREIASLADDHSAVKAGFRAVAQTCKDCHEGYRIDRD